MLSAIINIVTLFQIVFFTAFLFFKRSNRLSNQLLIGFLIAQGLVYINNLGFFFYDYVYNHFPHLFFVGEPFKFLWAPLLYLYICSLTRGNFALKRKLIPHFIPFLAAFMFLLFTYYIYDAETKRLILRTRNISLYIQIWSTLVHVQILVYIIFAIIRLNRFTVQLKNNYASLDKINLNWMRILLYSYMVAWLITLSIYFMQWIVVSPPELLMVIVFLFFLAFFNIIVFKALTTPEIFYNPHMLIKEKRKSLSENKRKQYLVKLEKYVQEHKPYLSPTINLNELAEMVDIPSRSLSEVLNDSLNQSFFDFINTYRINEVEQLLMNSKDTSLTVSEIIYDVGFNSKSAFYSAFKKYKGYPPAQLKQMRNTRSSL
jgi:AraC-like DNA-binding protein